ncbi:MAG: sigma 54-interacting transcriptional regulator [Desulfobacterales bacterium]
MTKKFKIQQPILDKDGDRRAPNVMEPRIQGRRKADEEISLNISSMKSLIRILEHRFDSVHELLDYALEEAISLTESKIGYIYYYNEDRKEFILNTWSKEVMKECSIVKPQTCYELDKTGIWGEAVRQRKEIIINDFQAAHPLKKGYPKGHARLYKYMSVPVLSGEKIVAVIGVANKTSNYNTTDVLQLTLLMDSVWKVVEKRKIEKELRTLTLRQEAILSAVPDIIMEVDINKVYTWANQAGIEFFGEDVIGKEAAFYFEGEQDTYQTVQQLFNGDENIIYVESWQRRKDGQRRLLAWWCRMFKDADGNTTGALSSGRDITEQKQAEESLRESESKLNKSQAIAHLGSWSLELSTNRLIWSDEVYRIFGLQPQEFTATYDAFLDAVHPEDRAAVDAAYSGSLREGKDSYEIEHRIIRRDTGEIRYIHEKCEHERDASGKIIRSVGMVHDITERKYAEEEIKNSETRYRRLFETAKDGIIILDAETGQIIDVNPFLMEMVGYSHKELLGKKIWEIGAFKDVEASKATFRKLQREKYVRYSDLPVETKDGRAIYVEFISNVYLVNHNKVIQCNVRDITERKLFSEALQKANSELEQRVEKRTAELRTAIQQLEREIEERTRAEKSLSKAFSEIKQLKDQLETENVYLRQEIKMKHRFGNITGKSDGLKYVLYRAEQVAPTNTTVLILGETGTGKELIAGAIHNMSPRKDRPMITVNCAALPANLMESELFGREKGAFTGADTLQIGRFEVANGSTLCLDEIGELPLEMQAKLLRAIQHSEFERLGSSRTIKVDVRIVATTNRNLEEAIRKGWFRQDLYYRLNVFSITVPPLRQRQADIPLLVQEFIERYARKLGKQITSINKDTMKTLQDYPWPGNVRELESVIERAAILSQGPVLHLTDKLEIAPYHSSSTVKTLEESERNQIVKILSETRWRIEGNNGAAEILGLHPSTLRAKMHKLGIHRPGT